YEVDTRPFVGHGGTDASRKAVYVDSPRVAVECGERGLLEALACANEQEIAGDLGWIADSPLGRSPRLFGGGRGEAKSDRGVAWLRTGSEPLGSRVLAPFEGYRDGQPFV